MSDTSPLRGSGMNAGAMSVASMELAVDRVVAPLDSRRDTLNRWSAALARGDRAEVDRLVTQSRIDRAWVAASGRLGAMLGGRTASSEIDERALPGENGLLADERSGLERRRKG